MKRISTINFLPRATSAVSMLSLFLLLIGLAGAQESLQRVRSERSAFSAAVPVEWEVFTKSEEDPNELLFCQSPEGKPEVTVSFTTYPLTGSWSELVRRQTYHLVVVEGSSALVDEELKLRGARGHKWAYRGMDSEGRSRLFYRLYLALPPMAGKKKLLFVQGVAPPEQSAEMLPLFNSIARSMAWGLQAELPLSEE